jgi:SAM-dependent methyltransferase
MDAGCGTGRLTAGLLERLPRGRVVAVDLSQNMLEEAHAHLSPRFDEQVEFVRADLAALPFDGAFDGVFSTAAFRVQAAPAGATICRAGCRALASREERRDADTLLFGAGYAGGEGGGDKCGRAGLSHQAR